MQMEDFHNSNGFMHAHINLLPWQPEFYSNLHQDCYLDTVSPSFEEIGCINYTLFKNHKLFKITFTAYLYGKSYVNDTDKIIEENFPFWESNPGHLGESQES